MVGPTDDKLVVLKGTWREKVMVDLMEHEKDGMKVGQRETLMAD